MKTQQTEQQAEALGYAEASEQFKTQGSFSSGQTWDNNPELNEAYDRGVNRAEAEHTPAQASGNCQTSHSPLPGDAEPIRVGPSWVTCPVCKEEYNTSSVHECPADAIPADVYLIIKKQRDANEARLKAHAQRLADAIRESIRNEDESFIREALAQWSKDNE